MSKALDLEAKFKSRVDARTNKTGCHLWTTARTTGGYGRFYIGNYKSVYAHRWIMEQELGRPLEATEEVLHSCDNPPCVNPAHLSVGSHADNMKDMAARGRGGSRHANTTHCPQGHPYEGENLRIRKDGARGCRACTRDAAERKRRDRGRPIKSPPFCPKGHAFTTENTRIKKSGKGFARTCRECERIYNRAYWARKKAER